MFEFFHQQKQKVQKNHGIITLYSQLVSLEIINYSPDHAWAKKGNLLLLSSFRVLNRIVVPCSLFRDSPCSRPDAAEKDQLLSADAYKEVIGK